MSDPNPRWQQRIGEKLEQISHDIFDGFRWLTFVALTRYIALQIQSELMHYLSYALAAVLLLFMLAVFMLRGEINLFRGPGLGAKVGNILVNMTICLGAFAACMWLAYEFVDQIILYQETS
ncbi:MAG: hypothetical protein ABJL67_14810 [Sulfitobacter sp.]